MHPTRRRILAASAVLTAAPLLRAAAAAPLDPSRLSPRQDGVATAKNRVEEWFSFTCPHCAAFAKEVYPDVKAKLVDPGKLLYVFREFPRDKLDLLAAMVARSLPQSRYVPFMMALFATQQHWAFNQESDPKEELAKMASLAGMSRSQFDQVTQDETLQQALLDGRTEAEQKYSVDSTPTFIVNGKSHSGEMAFDRFAALMMA